MAHKLGISFQSFSKIERGITDVNISRINQISKILDISLVDLFSFNESVNYHEIIQLHKILLQKNEEILQLQKTTLSVLKKQKK